MKVCFGCGESKPLADYHKKLSSKDGVQSRCKVCNNASVRQWQEANPDKFEKSWRKHSYGPEALLKRKASRYGLAPPELKQLIDDADGKCQLCKKERPLVIDHCHSTLEIRGLLCNQCNTALGLFKDNIETLRQAIVYLDH